MNKQTARQFRRQMLKTNAANRARGLREKIKVFSARKMKDEMDAWTPRHTPRSIRRLWLGQ